MSLRGCYAGLGRAELSTPRRGTSSAKAVCIRLRPQLGTPLLHPPDKPLAWPWSEDTPRIESAWVPGFCTHAVNTGRLASLWRDCGILTWDQQDFFGFH